MIAFLIGLVIGMLLGAVLYALKPRFDEWLLWRVFMLCSEELEDGVRNNDLWAGSVMLRAHRYAESGEAEDRRMFWEALRDWERVAQSRHKLEGME